MKIVFSIAALCMLGLVAGGDLIVVRNHRCHDALENHLSELKEESYSKLLLHSTAGGKESYGYYGYPLGPFEWREVKTGRWYSDE
jgi:hypothetical protein